MVRADTHTGVGSSASAWSARLTAGIPAPLRSRLWALLYTMVYTLAGVSAGTAAEDSQTLHGPIQEQAPLPLHGEPPAPDASTPWLDEVRAQRRSWEEKRDAARSAYEARRRANNPKAAAQQEAWEEDVQRRRAVRHERMQQERELYRSLGPSLLPAWPWPWPNQGFGERLENPSQNPTWQPDAALDPFAPALPGDAPVYAPQGWDNHWYFRGF